MKRAVVAAAGLALAAIGPAGTYPARAQVSDDVVKVGVLTDMSSLYSDINGQGAVVATQMAIDDMGGKVLGKPVELVQADVQNKPDVAVSTAGRWYDVDKVDVILGTGASSSSIATMGVAGQKHKIYLATDPASSDITGKLCNPYTVHWVYDTAALANGTGSAVVKAGGDTWFFITADYAFGHALERDVTKVVLANGGKVLGGVRAPLNTSDFSSFLLQAQASGAKVIGLANAGGDTINSIKQAAEFGIVKGGQKLAGLLVFISDVHSLGLKLAQGLNLTEAFYWDQTDATPRLREALRREVRRQDADQHPGRVLFGDEALSRSDQGGRHRRRRQGHGGIEKGAVRRPGLRQELYPPGRPQRPRHVSVRGQEARGIERSVGLLQTTSARSPATRRSARWTRATARW